MGAFVVDATKRVSPSGLGARRSQRCSRRIRPGKILVEDTVGDRSLTSAIRRQPPGDLRDDVPHSEV
jgi:hypothetical protein